MTVRIRRSADDVLEADVAGPLAAAAAAEAFPETTGVIEIVPGMERLAVLFDPLAVGAAAVEAALRRALAAPAPGPPAEAGEIEIPVVYGGDHGPDLKPVAEATGLSPGEVVRRHAASPCRVVLLGFTPGFAYMDGLDPALDVPRLASPRPRVEAGSVAVAAGRAGLYPLAGPGGWRILGRTDAALFDPAAADPFVLKPGARVRFVAVDGP